MSAPTGSQSTPPHVRRAKNIRQEIFEEADMGDDEIGGLDIDLDEILSEAETECETDLSASPDAQQGSRRVVNGIDIAPGGHDEGHDSAVRGADRTPRPIVLKRGLHVRQK